MGDSRLGGAWLRTLELVTSRFEVCGVSNPVESAVDWCRSPDQEWLHSARADRVLVESTRAAIQHRAQQSQSVTTPGAADPYLLNAAQIARILDAPESKRMALVLNLMDGLSMDETAGLLGATVTAVRLAVNDVDDELAELADEPLEGAAESGHLSTLQLRAFAAEQLDALPMQQHEEHVTQCSACFARFDAWARHQDAFVVPEVEPPRRSLLLPLLVVGMVLLVVAGVTLTSVAWFLVVPAEQEPVGWRDATPHIELLLRGEPVNGPVSPGAIVQIAVDPAGGGTVGFVRRQGDALEVLAVVAMAPEGTQTAPVDLLAPQSGEVEVFVVTSSGPLNASAVLGAITDDGPETAVAQASFTVGG